MSKRPTLDNYAPKKVNAPVDEKIESPTTPAKTYPKVSVYLDADEVRTIKLIGIDRGQRVSDICAAAIREWLERNGHARGKIYEA